MMTGVSFYGMHGTTVLKQFIKPHTGLGISKVLWWLVFASWKFVSTG